MKDKGRVRAAQKIATLIRSKKPVPCSAGPADEYIVALDSELRRLRRVVIKRIEHQLVWEHCGLDGTTYLASWHELMRAIGMKPRCRRCGCVDERACPGGCSWVEVGLCSACDLLPDPLRKARA